MISMCDRMPAAHRSLHFQLSNIFLRSICVPTDVTMFPKILCSALSFFP